MAVFEKLYPFFKFRIYRDVDEGRDHRMNRSEIDSIVPALSTYFLSLSNTSKMRLPHNYIGEIGYLDHDQNTAPKSSGSISCILPRTPAPRFRVVKIHSNIRRLHNPILRQPDVIVFSLLALLSRPPSGQSEGPTPAGFGAAFTGGVPKPTDAPFSGGELLAGMDRGVEKAGLQIGQKSLQERNASGDDAQIHHDPMICIQRLAYPARGRWNLLIAYGRIHVQPWNHSR